MTPAPALNWSIPCKAPTRWCEAWDWWWTQYSTQGWQVYEDIERLANPFPHPLHGVGSGPVGVGWDPAVRGTRADARNTDNLRAMRDIAVCLMAEETGNEPVKRLCREWRCFS